MRAEEAIDMIQNDIKLHHDYLSGTYRKALNMAIEVGDEVFFNGGPRREKAIVLRLYQPKMYKPISDVLWIDGSVEKMVLVENLIRTGRHFDEVDGLLKKMRGKQK